MPSINMTGTSNRTNTQRTFNVRFDSPQLHQCCGQLWQRWDEENLPVQWDQQDGEPSDRVSQCRTCGSIKASDFTARRTDLSSDDSAEHTPDNAVARTTPIARLQKVLLSEQVPPTSQWTTSATVPRYRVATTAWAENGDTRSTLTQWRATPEAAWADAGESET